MREMSFEEVRSVQMELLADFHNFCSEHNLSYFLDHGTLLGAVRHQGFIPWDDDVDVGMPREDYERFMQLAEKGYGNSVLLLPDKSIYTYLKVLDKRTKVIEVIGSFKNEIGVYLDVFPKDGVPDKNFKGKFLCFAAHNLTMLHWFNHVSVYKWQESRKFWQIALAFLGRSTIASSLKDWPLQKISKLARKFCLKDCPYAATILSDGMKNCVKRECFDSFRVNKFENLTLRIPEGYDEYLRVLYGDYMEQPPSEQRTRKHNNTAYWI